MFPTLTLVATVVFLLALERITVYLLTNSSKRIEWTRRQRVLHPNAISIIRIPMGLVSAAIWWAGQKELALVWFSLWMITDITDGTIARKCDLATDTGKWLDPLSDKCMYFPVLILFALTPSGPIPVFWVIAFLLIDTLGQASRHFIRKKSANSFGKVKTALVTILLATAALHLIHPITILSPQFFYLLTASCTILGFLSLYCKVIPDTWYANTLTLANFLCGIAAIYSILIADNPLRGFILIFAGQFFDLFDGRLARKFGSTRHAAIYDDVADVADLGHSERLVRVLPPEYGFAPRDLALDVRLAHGVRKRMVFALVDAEGERIKVNVFILGRELRANALRATVFRQVREDGEWVDAEVTGDTAKRLENAILSRAREMRVAKREQN